MEKPEPLTAKMRFWRLVYMVSLVAFVMPFVGVKGCKQETIVPYTGVQLLKEDYGWIYWIPLGAAFIMLLASRNRLQVGPLFKGWLRSLFTVVACVSVIILYYGPRYQFLFSTIYPKAGQVVTIGCWVMLFLASYWVAYRLVVRYQHSGSGGCEVRFPLLRVLIFLLGISFSLSLPVGISLETWMHSHPFKEQVLGAVWAFLALIVFSVPACFMTYFWQQGVKLRERWAVASAFIFACGVEIAYLIYLLRTMGRA